MSTSLRPFAFEDNLVRIVMHQADPWFVAKDVCRVLGIQNTSQAVQRLDEDEKGICSTYTPYMQRLDVDEKGTSLIRTLGGDQEMIIISESGLYTIVLRSRAATTPGSVAHRFRKWVTAEVLPSIRKAGLYEMPSRDVDDGDEERGIHLGPLSDVAVRARLVEIAERLSGKPAARALWQRLGLPWVEEMSQADEKSLISTYEDDAVARFAREGVEQVSGIATPAAMLWPAFASFCARFELFNPGEMSFLTRFGRMGFSKRKIGGRSVYSNIRPVNMNTAEAQT